MHSAGIGAFRPAGTIDAGCNDLFSQASHKGRVENFFVPFVDLV